MERVLHINDYPADAGGGAEIVMGRTIAISRRHGFTTGTFTSADLGPAPLTPWRYIDNATARQALADKLTAFRPDVVHLHNFYHVLSPGILAALAEFKRRFPLRVVMTAHDYHLACPNSGGSSVSPLDRPARSHRSATARVTQLYLDALVGRTQRVAFAIEARTARMELSLAVPAVRDRSRDLSEPIRAAGARAVGSTDDLVAASGPAAANAHC